MGPGGEPAEIESVVAEEGVEDELDAVHEPADEEFDAVKGVLKQKERAEEDVVAGVPDRPDAAVHEVEDPDGGVCGGEADAEVPQLEAE